MKNTRTKIQLLILAVTVILSIVAFMYLPDVAAVQWNSAGATNYLPKIVGWKRPVKIGRCRLLLKASSPRAERKARFVGLLY